MKPNQDQILSLIRTALKIIGTALMAHGSFKDAALWEEITGLVLTAAGIWMSFSFHKDEPAATQQPTESKKSNLPILFLAGLLAASMCLAPVGCRTAPDVAIYQTEGVVITTVDAAMQAWSDWVKGGNGVTQEQIDAVKSAYLKYYASQQALRDAMIVFKVKAPGESPASTEDMDAAIEAANRASADLIGIVQAFLRKGKQ